MEELAVADNGQGGDLGSGGVWRGWLLMSGASTLMCVLSSEGVAAPGGVRWSRRREAGGFGLSRVLVAQPFLWGAPVVSSEDVDGDEMRVWAVE